MAQSEKALITETSLADIADAIREKLGVTTTYLPGEMATAIRSIGTAAQASAATVNNLSDDQTRGE